MFLEETKSINVFIGENPYFGMSPQLSTPLTIRYVKTLDFTICKFCNIDITWGIIG